MHDIHSDSGYKIGKDKAEGLYQRNTKLGTDKLDVSKVIIPTPKSVSYDKSKVQLDLSTGINIDFGNVEKRDVSVALARFKHMGFSENSKGVAVKLAILADKNKTIGSYQLQYRKMV